VTETRPLRVLVVFPFGVLGGAEIWLLRLLEATDRLACSAVVLAEGPLREELARRGIDASVHPTGRTAAEIAARVRDLASEIRALRPDVVLALGVKGAAAAVPAARLAGVPSAWARPDHSLERTLARPLGRLCDGVVAISPEVADATGRADAVVITPPRPERSVPRGRARKFWAARGLELGDEPTLVMATRLIPYKGVDDAIAALADERAQGWRLVVVGGDDYATPGETDRLRGIAAAAGVGDRVAFTGPVEGAGRYLGAFDALAVLTRSDRTRPTAEGFGIAALEAMAAGVPVVATESGSLVRMVEGGAGVLVPQGAPAAVAEALGRLASPSARRKASRAAKASAARHPDARAGGGELVRVLAELAARPGAGLEGRAPVSVVTTVLNEGAAVDRLLAALVPQLRQDDDFVVVDGGSTDDTADRVRRWGDTDPRVRLVVAPGTNISQGRNRGAGEATHDRLAFTDAGCVPAAGWLDALRAALAEEPPPALVTGTFRAVADGPWETAMAVTGYRDPEEARGPAPLFPRAARFMGWVWDPAQPTGRSLAVTREAWEAVGGFPEHLATAEDFSFGMAVAASGRRCVLAADAEVAWFQRPDVRSTARMFYGYGVGNGVSGNPGLVGRDLARVAAYAGAALVAWRGGRVARLAVALGALVHLWRPLKRGARRPRPARVAALAPLALAIKDLAKAAGCLRGLGSRWGLAPPLRERPDRQAPGPEARPGALGQAPGPNGSASRSPGGSPPATARSPALPGDERGQAADRRPAR